MEENNTHDEKSAWNLSSKIIEQIGMLLQRASSNYSSGRIQNSFYDTKEVNLLLFNDLSNEEEAKLKELELDICKVYSVLRNYDEISECSNLKPEQEARRKKLRAMHNHKVTEYRKYTMTLLGSYGYLVAKKEDTSHMF